MPPATKLHRSGKLATRRLVYVSWLEQTKQKLEWIENFFERIRTETLSDDETFDEPLRTGDQSAAELKAEWLGSLTKAKQSRERRTVTDVVGVCTNTYILQNATRNANGELAQIVELIAKDKRDRIRVWLAPVDPPNWMKYKVRDIVLADPDKVHASWLVRLKEDKRFVWPEEGLAKCTDEIHEAVATIVDRPLE